MKNLLPILWLILVVGGRAAADDSDLDRVELDRWLGNRERTPPSVDTQRLVQASNSFLHEREPELTPEEYALYEKMVALIASNPDFAVKVLANMVGEKERPSPAFDFVLGNAYYAAKQTDLAEKSFRSAVTRYPEYLRAWRNLGVLYYASDRLPEAVQCLSKAMTLGDRDPSTLGLLGYCLEVQGNLPAAEMAYLQAASSESDNTDWQDGLLRIYLKGRQYGRAEPLVRALIRKKPADTRLWFDYAGILISDHRKLEAIAVLEEARTAGGAGPDELALLGDLYAEQGLAAEAADVYANLLRSAGPRGEQKLTYYAQVLIAAGKLPEAEHALALVKGDLTPAGRIMLLQTRADLLMARKQWPDARREIEALIALAPLNGHALVTLGRIYVEEKDLANATITFETAYRIPESTYQASLELAKLEVTNRHYAKAVGYLQRALQLQRTEAVEDYLGRIRALLPADNQSG